MRAPFTATVATGMPLGICTMDSRESSPSRVARATGTPMTGRVLTEASMPGRWAAPPAPATSTRTPRPAASWPKASMSSGVRWADTTRSSWGTSKCSSTSVAPVMTSRSDELPMTTLTSGASAPLTVTPAPPVPRAPGCRGPAPPPTPPPVPLPPRPR